MDALFYIVYELEYLRALGSKTNPSKFISSTYIGLSGLLHINILSESGYMP